MRLATHLDRIETNLRPEDEVPGVLIVLEEDGVWRDWEGTVTDRCSDRGSVLIWWLGYHQCASHAVNCRWLLPFVIVLNTFPISRGNSGRA